MGANILQNIPMLGGVNLLVDPRNIDDTECVRTQNVCPVIPGVMTKRLGRVASLPAFATTFTPAGHPVAAAVPGFLNTDVQCVYACSFSAPSPGGLALAVLKSTGVTSYQPMAGMPTTGTRPTFASLNGAMYCFPGYPSQVSGYKIDTTGAISTFAFKGVNNAITPKVVAAYKSRFVYANFGPGYENTIVFSDNYLPDTIGDFALAANGRNLVIGGARDGDRIVAMVEVMLTGVGDPTQAGLLVLRENSAYLITGAPNQSTDSTTPFIGDLDVKKYTLNCGCSSAETVVQTRLGTLWAGPDDVWLFQAGQLPIPVGTKIQPALARTPASQRYRWSAAYFNGFYRLAVYSEGAGPNNTSGLVGDVVSPDEVYFLELREYQVPQAWKDAHWYGPMKYKLNAAAGVVPDGVSNFIVDTRPGVTPTLLSVETAILVDGTTRYVTPVSYDTGNVDSITSVAVSTTYPQPVAADILSKDYTFGSRVLDKVFNGVEVAVRLSEPSQLSVDCIIDKGKYLVSMSKQLAADGSFQLDTTALDSGRFFEEELTTELYTDPNARVGGKSVQVRLYDTSGIAVPTALPFGLIDQLVPTPCVVTIPAGFYADMNALCAVLEPLVQAVMQTGDHYTVTYGLVGPGLVSIQNADEVAGLVFINDAAYAGAAALLGIPLGTSDVELDSTTFMPLTRAAYIEFSEVNLEVWPQERRPAI